MDKAKEFDKKVKSLIQAAQKAEDTAVVDTIRLLAQARTDVAASVAATDWQAYHLPQLQAAIDRALQAFAWQYGMQINAAQGQFWSDGVNKVDIPLREVGITALIPAIDTALLVSFQDYSRHLVKSLGQEAAAKIYNEMALGMIGKKTPFEVMEAVGKNLKDPSVFKSIAVRAETITRQECGRALEAASQARLEKAAEVVPGMKKQWLYGAAHRIQPRVTHMIADGQIRDADQPFNVGGEALMYPRGGSDPRNNINCQCYSAPYMAEWNQ
jgi:hypothetical protein